MLNMFFLNSINGEILSDEEKKKELEYVV